MREKENSAQADSFLMANACSPLQMTERVIGLLKQENVPPADVQELLEQLARSLNQRFTSPCNRAVFEDAVLRVP